MGAKTSFLSAALHKCSAGSKSPKLTSTRPTVDGDAGIGELARCASKVGRLRHTRGPSSTTYDSTHPTYTSGNVAMTMNVGL